MKKLFLFAASILAFASCNPEEKKTEPEIQDSISIFPEEKVFTHEGGNQSVVVTSSGEWTMTGEFDWVKPSVTSGVDGDEVKFTADPNPTQEDRTAEFVFTTGEATAKFTVISKATTVEPLKLELVSPAEMSVPFEVGQIELLFNTNIDYRALEHSISEGADWLSYKVTLEGSEPNTAKMYFDVTENPALESRTAEITVSADGVEPVKVTVVQKPESVIKPEKEIYYVTLEESELNIPVIKSVEYDITVADGWVTHKSSTDTSEVFAVSSFDGDKRETVITFTEKDADEPVVATVTVQQRKPALIKYAADMTKSRSWPDFSRGNAQVLNNLSSFTLEAMVCPKDLNKGNEPISTIMGIEGKFLVRLGDVGCPSNQIQIATSYNNYTDPALTLEENKWYHIAVVFQNGTIQVYINGEEKGVFATSLNTVDFGIAHSDESNGKPRCFWVGYSYNSSRDFRGLITEIRIWNKALSAGEIQAKDHFYTVDPASEGLVTYWNFNEGADENGIVKDATTTGNRLQGESFVGIEWKNMMNIVEIALPE